MDYGGIAQDPGDLLQVIFTENISEVNALQERNVKKKSSTDLEIFKVLSGDEENSNLWLVDFCKIPPLRS